MNHLLYTYYGISLNGGDYSTYYFTDKIGDIKLYEISESHKEIIA